MKVYIVGAVTGHERQDVVKKFAEMECKLKDMGFVTVNPVNLVPEVTGWTKAMKVCISELIQCDAIVKLPCWETSKGGMLEVMIARNVGIEELLIV